MFEFCRQILEAGDLGSKLAPPPANAFEAASQPAAVRNAARPARDRALAMRGGVDPLPRARELSDASARATCLARFAHHELMAVELFAWAILRWPDLALSLRRGLLGVLAEEQLHCRLYLERLRAHGSDLSEHVLSDYFWKHVPRISDSPWGPAAFLSAMGLTFEQANLDFAPLYRDAFRAAGDEASASACERVHRDEIGHVRFALRALRALAGETDAGGRSAIGDVELYERSVPFPLGASRAKGRRFERAARVEAGLSPELIEHVRTARAPQHRLDDGADRRIGPGREPGPCA